MIALQEGRIDAAALEAEVADPAFGAILTFAGVSRQDAGAEPLAALWYEAYAPMALPALQAIADEVEARWAARVAIVHRTGEVPIGEASVVIVVGAGHRGEAYEASRYAIDELKRRVPIWKKEVYVTGDGAWIANQP